MFADDYEFAPSKPQTFQGPRLCDVLNYGFDLGLQDYPIYDESDRDRLNQAIVDHFYEREISAETPGQFIFWLNRQMSERMPQINRVWEALKDRDILSTGETHSTATGESAATSESASTSDATAKARALNTNAPQVSMIGKDEMEYYDTGTGSTNDSSTSSNDRSTNSGTSKNDMMATSRSGYLSDAVAAWIDGYNNTDLMVFDALEPLFTHVYKPIEAW